MKPTDNHDSHGLADLVRRTQSEGTVDFDWEAIFGAEEVRHDDRREERIKEMSTALKAVFQALVSARPGRNGAGPKAKRVTISDIGKRTLAMAYLLSANDQVSLRRLGKTVGISGQGMHKHVRKLRQEFLAERRN